MLRQGKVYIVTALLSAALLTTMMLSGWFRHGREVLIDFMYTKRDAPSHTLIVEIDEQTITSIGQWPLPRSIYGDLVTKIAKNGAAVIAIDINFKERSQNPGDDDTFGQAIKNSKTPIVLTAEIQPDGSISHPISPLGGITAEGFPNIFTSSDGEVRSTRLTIQDFPSLALAVSRLYSQHSYQNLIIPDMPIRIAYPGPNRTYPFVSASEVLADKIPASFFKDRIIFIGATAKDLQDYHKTPVGIMSGVEIQAAITTTIVDDAIYKNLQTVSLILTIIFALGVGFLVMAIKRPLFFAAIIIALVVLYSLSVFIAFDMGYIVDLFYPNLGFIFTGALVLSVQYSATEKEKKFIQDTFSRYLAPEVIKELISNPEAIKLGGKKERLTILFSDIRNFTTVSETMQPEQLTRFLNAYLSRMTRVIFEHEGVIDKYIGDAIMAFWGAPLPNLQHAQDAIVSALEMIETLHEFNAQNEEISLPAINIGIGVNTGEVTVGNMGSEKRFDYTVMGDSVNLASRLEGLTKIYRVNIIIGEQTYKEIKASDFLIRELDRVQVKGKKNAVTIYEVVPTHSKERVQKIFEHFNRGRNYYYRGEWQKALTTFSAILAEVEDDGPTKLLEERCEQFLREPPAQWDGVYELTYK